jgi:hypothetical protein
LTTLKGTPDFTVAAVTGVLSRMKTSDITVAGTSGIPFPHSTCCTQGF